MKSLRTVYITFLFVTTIASIALADPVSDRVTKAYQERAQDYLIRGASVAVVSPELSNASATYSMGDVQSAQDQLEIGSVSKTFAAILAAQLRLENKLNLEAPISNYVTELSGTFVGSVTVHLLATHRAQLPDGFNGEEDATETELISFLKTYTPGAAFPPGVRQYSNTGFATLGLVISRVTKQDYADYARGNVLVPLHMTRTDFLNSTGVFSQLLKPFGVILQPAFDDVLGPFELAAGGIYSNANDMLKFVQAMLNPEKFVPELAPAVRLTQTLGLGWDSLSGVKPFWKNGGMSGFGSYLTIDQDKGVGAFAVVNNENTISATSIGQIAAGASDQYLQDLVPENAESLVGQYVDNTNGNSISISTITGGYLAIQSKGIDTVGGMARLRTFDQKTYTVYAGIVAGDSLTFLDAPMGKKAVDYSRYTKTDSQGNPVYVHETFVHL